MVRNLSSERHRETDIIGVVTFGFFLMLVGVIFIVTPALIDRIREFLSDFRIREVAPNIFLPEPESNHPVVYTAISQFCLAFGIFQVFVLGARFLLKDPVSKKAETISSLVFWTGASWVVSMLAAATITWSAFIAWLLILIGTSIIVRSSVVLVVPTLVKE